MVRPNWPKMGSDVTMLDDTDLLFVYGTLRRDLADGEARSLVHDLELVGAATVEGLLYDLGSYPGVIAGHGVVHGELLRVAPPERLAAIDAYEECRGVEPLFRRTLTRARFGNGRSVTAWIYLFSRSVDRAPRIDHGDYSSIRKRGG